MIQRFNFYDVYGYLVPGVTLLGIFWLPFGLVLGRWPSADWTSALVGLVFAYVAGHMLHSIAQSALPHIDPIPHNALLQAKDKTLSEAFKERLYDLIQNQFQIDVRPPPDEENLPEVEKKLLGGRRDDAFFLCREFLIRRGAISYAEQFQGMYALMRGLTAALFLGAAFHFGWGLGDVLSSPWVTCNQYTMGIIMCLFVPFVLALLALLKTGPKKSRDWLWLWLTVGVSFVVGVILGWQHPQGFANAIFMAFLGIGASWVAYRCYLGFKSFAKQFALSVYRGFAALY